MGYMKRFGRRRMANIRDVAKHAGVSIGTVSAALNDSASVSAETRRKVSRRGRGRRLRAERHRSKSPPRQEPAYRHRHRRHLQPVLLVTDAHDRKNSARGGLLDHRVQHRRRRRTRAGGARPARAQHVAGIILTPVGRGADYVKRLEARNLPPIVTVDQKVAGSCPRFRRRRQSGRRAHADPISPSSRPSADRHDHRHSRYLDVRRTAGCVCRSDESR